MGNQKPINNPLDNLLKKLDRIIEFEHKTKLKENVEQELSKPKIIVSASRKLKI